MSVGTRNLDDRVAVLEAAGGTTATALDTTGAAVNVSAAAPPTTGDVLTATSATTATWQAPAGGGAPVGAQYVALATDATLTNERVLTGSATVSVTDAGAGSTVTLAVPALALTDAHVAAANKDGVAGTASMRTLGTGAQQACAGNDSRLSDARTPSSTLAHAASHKSGGSDAIKLDELAAPTDVTTLNATTGAHGLLPKLPGGTATFLRADGAFAAPTASVSISQTEIDFGSTSVDGATFIVADANILAGSKIIGGVAYAAPTSKDISELDGEGLDLKFGVHSVGNLWIRARGQQPGQLCYGKWKINYLVG